MAIPRNLGNLAQGADTSGVLGPTKGGTGATSNAAAPFAVKGANSDITSLTGLTTALSVGQGGTGNTTAAAAFNALNPMTTTGDIIYEASPTTATRLPIGSTGQVLSVSGGIPTWTTVSSGAMALIETKTFTATQPITFSGISSSYQTVLLVIHSFSFISQQARLIVRLGTGSGPTIQSSGYSTNSTTISGSTLDTNGYTSDSAFRINYPAANTSAYTGYIYFNNMQATVSGNTTVLGQIRTNNQYTIFFGGNWTNSGTPITAIQLSDNTTGSVTMTGTVSLYGIVT